MVNFFFTRLSLVVLTCAYGFIKRHLMKKIARDKGNPDTDTSRAYVYTDWDGVKRFAEEFLELLASRISR